MAKKSNGFGGGRGKTEFEGTPQGLPGTFLGQLPSPGGVDVSLKSGRGGRSFEPTGSTFAGTEKPTPKPIPSPQRSQELGSPSPSLAQNGKPYVVVFKAVRPNGEQVVREVEISIPADTDMKNATLDLWSKEDYSA